MSSLFSLAIRRIWARRGEHPAAPWAKEGVSTPDPPFTTYTHRQVTTEEAEAKAAEFNVMFIETSAKAGHNVKTLFKKIAQALPGMDKAAEGEQANQSEC